MSQRGVDQRRHRARAAAETPLGPQFFLARHAAIIVTLLAFGGLYFSTIDSYGMLMWDEAHYATLGRALLRGEGYTNYSGRPDTFRPPVVPAASALSMLLAGSETDVAAKLPIPVFALVCLLLVYGVARREAGPLAGIAAALALGLFPTFWQDTAHLLTEIPFMTLYAAAVVFFHDGIHRNRRSFLIAWPCWALAALTRYTAVLFGPTVVLLLLLPLALRDRQALERVRSKEFLLAPVTAALILAPWLVRTWMHTGNPLKGFTYAAGQVPAYNHASMPALFYLQELPGMIGWIPVALIVVAFGYAVVIQRQALGITCCIAVLVIVGWMQQYDWKEVRLITAIQPFLAILIGLGVATAAQAFPAQGRWAFLAAIGAIAIAAFAVAYGQTSHHLRTVTTLGYPSFGRAMAYLKDETPQGTRLLGANCHQIFWYADRRCRALPKDETELTSALSDADWVVITNFERGQPSYARDIPKRLQPSIFETGRAKAFTDKRWATVLVSAEMLRILR